MNTRTKCELTERSSLLLVLRMGSLGLTIIQKTLAGDSVSGETSFAHTFRLKFDDIECVPGSVNSLLH